MNTGWIGFSAPWITVLAVGGLAAHAAGQSFSALPPVHVAQPAIHSAVEEQLRRLPPIDAPPGSTVVVSYSEPLTTDAVNSPGDEISVSWEPEDDAAGSVAPDAAFAPPVFEPLPKDSLTDDDDLIQIAPDPVDPWCADPFGRYAYRGSGSPPGPSDLLPGSGDRMGILTFVFDGITTPREGKNSWGLAAEWHLVGGPKRTDMPPQLWDFTAHFGRRNRLDAYWSYDVAVRPGWFSDFAGSAREGLRFPGHGVLYYTPSDEFQMLIGIDYLDRDDIAWLPVVGAVFKPHPDFRLDAVFPRPRIASRLSGDRWLYLAAEMDGGTWAIQRADRTDDVATYRDYRLCLGVQQGEESTSYLEVGYVFARHLEYRSGTPSYNPLSTTLLRLVVYY